MMQIENGVKPGTAAAATPPWDLNASARYAHINVTIR